MMIVAAAVVAANIWFSISLLTTPIPIHTYVKGDLQYDVFAR